MRLLIANGGTGGHLYPGIAVAQEFLSRHPENEVLFVGTRRGMEAAILPQLNYPVAFIAIHPWMGKSFWEKIKTVMIFPVSLAQSARIMLRFRPDFVLGVGGYASFPVMMAAFLLRKRRAIHEQNIIPGLTNRILARLVCEVFVSFEASTAYFPEKKAVFTGNPIRKFRELELKKQEFFTVFIFGGSQGAHSLNWAMLDALPLLFELKDKIHIIHQTGRGDLRWVKSAYFQSQWKAEIYDFIQNIESIYAKSDYVICRAGASSLGELSFLRKASTLIPYPHAARNHQEQNARVLEKQQAARVLLDWQLNGIRLAQEIKWAFHHPRELEEMRKNIVRFSQPYAARAIVDELTR